MKKYYEKDGIDIYCMDNLELMRSLEDESITLIYCDVLYNSGKNFSNYADNLGSPKQAVQWYRPRFEEMKRILKPNGSVWIHCNWRLDSYLRCLLDEIFGLSSYRSAITRKHSDIRGFVREIDPVNDTILYYVKDSSNYIFNEVHDGTYRFFPLVEQGIHPTRSITLPVPNGELNLKEMGMYLLPPIEVYMELLEKGEVTLKDGKLYRFEDVLPISNNWSEPEMRDTYNRAEASVKGSDAYDTPKPDAVLSNIIKIASNKGDIVADFFLGGGTTAVIAKRYGRKGIFCDINKDACDATIKKL